MEIDTAIEKNTADILLWETYWIKLFSEEKYCCGAVLTLVRTAVYKQ